MKISSDIKDFIAHAGKVLIYEHDEPKYVVAEFKGYMEMVKKCEANLESILAEKSAEYKENPYVLQNSRSQHVIQDINNELEAIAREDFFSPMPEEHAPVPAHSQQFYRELE